jgi:hypothetical protein
MQFDLGAIQTASPPPIPAHPNHQLLRPITNRRFPNLCVPAEGLLQSSSTVSKGRFKSLRSDAISQNGMDGKNIPAN